MAHPFCRVVEAIVLAAGEGSRLRPLTVNKPKPMLRVANKPILQHVLEALAANGVEDVTLVLGHQRARVQSHFGDGRRFGVRLRYAFQDALTGTTQALASARRPTGDALVLGGDNLVDAALVRRALDAPPGPAVVVHRSDAPSRYGVVKLAGGRVEQIEEKPASPASGWVSTGVYRMPAEFHDLATAGLKQGILGLSDVLQQAIEGGLRVEAVRSDDLWADAVYPWDLLRLNAEFLRRHPPPEPALPPGVFAEGPVLVGRNVRLAPGTVLSGGTVIGDNVTVDAQGVLESCLILDDVQLGARALVQSSILGEGTRVGPRFSALSGPCDVKAGHEWHTLSGFGAVLGEDCHAQANVTLMPGCMVGNRVRIGPGRTLTGAFEDGSFVA